MSAQRFDFVIIGAGAAGEAAAHYARGRGASVAIIERDLFGGSCAYWACMPSKTLLHCAEVRAHGGDYPWPKASARRDYMINRIDRDYPDDSSHVKRLESAGATTIRGVARLAGPHRVEVRRERQVRAVEANNVVIAVGSVGKVPEIEGMSAAGYWTNVEATALRELPRSVVIFGAGPSGVEIAQYLSRYGVRTTILAPRMVNPTDHPKSSATIAEALRRDGVDVRQNVRAVRVHPRGGTAGEHLVELSDGSSVSAEVLQLSVGRTSASALAGLGLDTIGVAYDGADALQPDEHLRIADGTYVIGDVMDRELSTHLGHYEGEMAVRVALGEDVRVDLSAVPRAVYTEPETAAVGVRLDQARDKGLDAFEETTDFATSTKGYIVEADLGHASIVVDRSAKTLLGAFIAGAGASEAIHVAVLALKLRTPIDTLAQTIHAFPTMARELGGLFASAATKLR